MERNSVPEQYKWNTKALFEDEHAWNALYSETLSEIDFSKYQGKLKDEKTLFDCLKFQEYILKKVEKLYLYAHMKRDEDTSNSKNLAVYSKAQSLYVKLSSSSSFITPELTALDENILKGFIKNHLFSDYDYMLESILKNKKHILSKNEENLLALGGEVFSSFKDIFSMIDNADLTLEEIDDGKGGTIKLTHATYGLIMHGEDRKLRERAFKSYYKAYISLINTISATYFSSVKKDVYISKARNYTSCLERALFSEDVPQIVYTNLLESVNTALPVMHRYINERKSALKLENMHMYDIYAPIVSGAEIKLDYKDAYSLVCKGLKPLGEKYGKILKQAFSDRWIDVEETKHKRSGAYSTGIFGYHPYVLLNYKQTTHDIFTIAHEMGHALHTYYAKASQPYAKADYRIFVAEVASTVNEVLLLKHIISTTEDKQIKKYLLSYFIDMIRGTLFRQTMFAEFEYLAHDAVEKSIPLDKDFLNSEYLKLNKKYYGNAIISDEEIKYEWARIPHFYSSFYVYKYATGIISAISIAERILSEGQKAVDDYIKFLSSGGSTGPIELLKIAGIDLTNKKPFEKAMQVFEDTLEEFISI